MPGNMTFITPQAGHAVAPVRRLQLDPVTLGLASLCIASVALLANTGRHWGDGRRLSQEFYSCDATTCKKSHHNDWQEDGDYMVSPSSGKKCRKCKEKDITGHSVVHSSSGRARTQSAYSVFPERIDHQVLGGMEGRSLANVSIFGGAAMLLIVMSMVLRSRFRGTRARALMEHTSEPQLME